MLNELEHEPTNAAEIYDSHCHLAALANSSIDHHVALPAILLSDISALFNYRYHQKLAKIGCGVHPWYLEPNSCLSFAELYSLAIHYQPDFIGETGLDRLKPNFELQLSSFRIHCEVAQATQLPVIIHCVRAYNELLRELNRYPRIRGIVHAFNGNREMAKQLARKNFQLGIGSLCLNPASQIHKSLARIPSAQLVLETDAPYMSLKQANGELYSPRASLLSYANQVASLQQKNLTEIINEVNQNWLVLFTVVR